MSTARIGKELVVKLHNEIGVLAGLTKTLAEHGINILAVSGWAEGETGLLHLVTDDNLRASDALRRASYNPQERDVVLVQLAHKPGMLRHLTAKLAEGGIDVHHLYASATDSNGQSLLVFASANNDRAVVLLNEPR